MNMNGIRIDGNRKALGGFTASLEPQPDVCVITETHLYDSEKQLVAYPTYAYANHSSKSCPETQACGGVLISERRELNFEKADGLPNVKAPLNGCSIQVHPQNPDVRTMRIAGAYFSPAA